MEVNQLRECASAKLAIPIGMIVFRIAGQEFCFDVRSLVGSLKPRELGIHRPNDAGHPGRVVFDGQDYLLIDMGPFLGTKNAPGSDAGWILLVEYGKRKLAFQVEAVTEIITGIGSKESQFRFVPAICAPHRLGYFETQSRKIWEIDFESVIRDWPGFRRAV